MKKNQILMVFFYLFLSCVFFVLGLYGGGALYLKITSIPLEYLNFNTLHYNWVTYGGDGASEKIRKSLYAGFIICGTLTLVPTMIFLFVIFYKNKPELYGSARFADDNELTKSGYFPKERKEPALLLGKMGSGKYKDQFVELVGKQFLGVSAPTGAGKGIGVVLPNAVNYSDSLVCNDIKLENFLKSAGFRKSQGQEVFLFSPDGYFLNGEEEEQGLVRSHRWNPLHYVRKDRKYRILDIKVITNSLYPLTGDGSKDMWAISASDVFLGLVLWMMDTYKFTKVLPTIPYMLSIRASQGGVVKWMKSEIENALEDGNYLSKECINEFNKFVDIYVETQSGILNHFDASLSIYKDEVVSAAVSGNDFDFNDLRKKGISLYIGVSPNKIGAFKGLLNLFFEQLISVNTRVSPEIDSTLIKQCLLLLDEFPAIGRVNQIKESIGYTRSYNLRFLLIYQDKSQLQDKALYGHEGADNITSNLAAEIIFPPKEVTNRVKEISTSLGTYTFKDKNKSLSGKFMGNTTTSNNYSKQSRELLKPHELIELGFEKHPIIPVGVKALVLKENQRSFIMNKLISPFEPVINDRIEYSLANVPEIPLLKFNY